MHKDFFIMLKHTSMYSTLKLRVYSVTYITPSLSSLDSLPSFYFFKGAIINFPAEVKHFLVLRD